MAEDRERRSRDIDYAKPLPEDAILGGAHRSRVGGKWDEMGELQLQFMVARGLRPEHRLLDVGCGSLRAGIRFVDYLEPGNYYGIDINETLLDAGYERELAPELQPKLPRENLRATERFESDFGVPFDFAIAQSLFTHISLNQIRLCLYRVAKVMPPGGRFFASYFEVPPEHPLDEALRGGRLWTERNAFFYYRRDLRYAARQMPWEVHHIGAWDHPRRQVMVEYRRIESPPQPAAGPSRLERTRSALRRRLGR